MKRTFGILAGLAVLGVVGSEAWAQSGHQPVQQTGAVSQAPPLRTRVALINMAKIVKGYTKWKAIEDYIKAEAAKKDAPLQEKVKQFNALRNQLNDPANAARRDEIDRQMKALKREVDDMGEEARKEIVKLTGDYSKQVYLEIQDMVQAYARSNDIELVMHYTDAINPADLTNPANIQRKINNGATMPMYVAPGMDITDAIIYSLNERYKQAAQQDTGNR